MRLTLTVLRGKTTMRPCLGSVWSRAACNSVCVHANIERAGEIVS